VGRWSLVSLVLLVGLVSAGCSLFSPGGGIEDEEPVTETGTIVITAVQNGSVSNDVGVSALLVPTEATNLRIRLSGGGFNRNIVKDVKFENGKATVSLTVPIGTYGIHAIAYKTDGNYGTALTGGVQKNVLIEADKTTTTTVTLDKFSYELYYPQGYVKEDSIYTIKLEKFDTQGLHYYDDHDYRTDDDIWYVITSRSRWRGDTVHNLPDDAELHKARWGAKSTFAPDEPGGKVYFQWYRELSRSYNSSTNDPTGAGDSNLPQLYVYAPCIAYGESLPYIQTVPVGSISIEVQ